MKSIKLILIYFKKGKTSASQITTRAHKEAFKDAFVTACSEPRIHDLLCIALLFPFKEEINKVGTNGANPTRISSAYVDTVALFAHLMVHPAAAELLEKLSTPVTPANRPAALDNTHGGMRHGTEVIGDQLISVAETIKESIDRADLFAVTRIGDEGAAFVAAIDPSKGAFESGQKLLQMRTTFVNLYETLKGFVNRSGQGAEEGTLEYFKDAYDNFCGPQGRNKNVALWYCFVVWTGQPNNMRWISNNMDASGLGRGSTSSNDKNREQPTSSSKRVREIATVLKSVFKEPSPKRQTGPTAGDQLCLARASAVEADKLQKAMADPNFQLLPEDKKTAMRNRWFDLMGV